MMTNDRLLFDVNASYGYAPKKTREARWSVDHLLEDMDLAGIAGALVRNRLARYHDHMLANHQMMEEIAPHRDRLWPCWLAMPSLGPDFPSPEELAKQMRDHDIRAIYIEPWTHRIPLHDRVWRTFREAMLELDVVCLVPMHDAMTLDRLFTLLGPMKTVLLNARWGDWREIVDLMQAYPNLHMDFNTFQAHRAVEWFAEQFGSERLLFGTGLPDRAPGAARGFVDYSMLPSEQIDRFAAGNLRRLLHDVGPTTPPRRPADYDDAITQAARAGQPIPCFVMDAHCHIAHDGANMLTRDVVAIRGDAQGMLELREKSGIDRTAVMSWVGALSMDSHQGNEIVRLAVEHYPDHYIGLVTINPDYDDEATIEQIIQRYHVELQFPGLKTFCPAQSVYYDDPTFHRWFQFANDHHLYLVFDTAGVHPEGERALRHVSSRYPDLSIHLDHCGASWPKAKWAASMLKELPNVWAQLNYTDVANGTIEYLVNEVGADRVLFGTDSPMRDPRPQVTWLAYTRLTELEKQKVFGLNFQRILDRVQW